MLETTISLFDSFASVPDPRSALGKRHPLNAILTLCSVAMLCGCRSLFAIAQFGRDRGKHFSAALGFTREVPPCCTTLHNLFLVLDKVAFENAIGQWSQAAAGAHGWTTVSLDGKTLRGSTDVQLPGVHLLAAYAHEAGIVLRQLPVDAKTNEPDGFRRYLPWAPASRRKTTAEAGARALGHRKQGVSCAGPDDGGRRLSRAQTLCAGHPIHPSQRRAQRAATAGRQEPSRTIPDLLCRPCQGSSCHPEKISEN